ncbi:hypothetical protein JB92DRAFT_388282 [Gautieria morchelliformis]|nr:hypothetical protein JB92DRAFT_388282 [Gautieria morchelliformis]
MPSTFIHFEALRARVASHPHAPIFKLPKPGALGREWVNVSYKDFQADIERMAKYWLAKLASQGFVVSPIPMLSPFSPSVEPALSPKCLVSSSPTPASSSVSSDF